MHLHVLGLGGTFMSALAILARQAGFDVTGSDANCYPPVSDLLEAEGIHFTEGYEDDSQALKADCVIVGNAIKRGMPVIESVLDAGKAYTSGPQWLAAHILSRYRVMAVAGTHGKTTTTSMLSFILDKAGLNPGFLIGGVATDFNTSARLGKGDWFVIEADEYDSAFFDKRPKFMHYRPQIALLNNLEFDHADIYADLPAIQQQFQYFLRTVPRSGLVIKSHDDVALNQVISHAQYSQVEGFSLCSRDAAWRAELLDEAGQSFNVWHHNEQVANVTWSLIGGFNVENGLAAIAASVRAGVTPEVAAKAIERFTPVKRRLEQKYEGHGVIIYDDFAHHPTAIGKTLKALKQSKRHQRILLVLEFASFTMRSGVHASEMTEALAAADMVYVLNPSEFNLIDVAKHWRIPYQILNSTTDIVESVAKDVLPGDAVLVMSNRGFENIHQRLAERINR